MKIIISVFMALSATLSFGQSREELLDQFIQMRKQMLEEVQKIFDEDLSTDNFFSDNFKGFNGFKSFSSGGQNLNIEEKYLENGKIVYLITPKNKNISFEITTDNGQIQISSEMAKKEDSSSQFGQSQFFSMSKSQRSIAIPEGYKVIGPEKEGDAVKITLVPETTQHQIVKPKKDSNRIPISKVPGEQTI